MRVAAAVLRVAQAQPPRQCRSRAGHDGSAALARGSWLVEAFMLEAMARDALGEPAVAARAVERALDLAEPDGAVGAFLLYPAPGLLERHTRQRTAHPALLGQILDLLANVAGRRPPGRGRRSTRSAAVSCACSATCRPTCRHRRSPPNCPSRRAPSRPTCGTCTPSSARTAGPSRRTRPRPRHARTRGALPRCAPVISKFCCYCGKHLDQRRYISMMDEEEPEAMNVG